MYIHFCRIFPVSHCICILFVTWYLCSVFYCYSTGMDHTFFQFIGSDQWSYIPYTAHAKAQTVFFISGCVSYSACRIFCVFILNLLLHVKCCCLELLLDLSISIVWFNYQLSDLLLVFKCISFMPRVLRWHFTDSIVIMLAVCSDQ